MIKQSLIIAVLAVLALLFVQLFNLFNEKEELPLIASYYAQNTAAETGSQNIVTAIVVTYRGLDTLGEVTVLFLAAALVGFVLRKQQKGEGRAKKAAEEQPNELLATGSRLLAPFIMLLGVSTFLNGHLTPGGGFQGGTIIASGVLLTLLADPQHAVQATLLHILESLSGFGYVLIGILGLVLAGGFLDNRILPLGNFGTLLSAGAIPLIYTLIGIKVGTEFTAILGALEAAREEE